MAGCLEYQLVRKTWIKSSLLQILTALLTLLKRLLAFLNCAPSFKLSCRMSFPPSLRSPSITATRPVLSLTRTHWLLLNIPPLISSPSSLHALYEKSDVSWKLRVSRWLSRDWIPAERAESARLSPSTLVLSPRPTSFIFIIDISQWASCRWLCFEAGRQTRTLEDSGKKHWKKYPGRKWQVGEFSPSWSWASEQAHPVKKEAASQHRAQRPGSVLGCGKKRLMTLSGCSLAPAGLAFVHHQLFYFYVSLDAPLVVLLFRCLTFESFGTRRKSPAFP